MRQYSDLNPATGMQNLIVRCVAVGPFLAMFIGYIFRLANGASTLLDRQQMDLDVWDHTAMSICMFFQLVVPNASLYCVNDLVKPLKTYVSDFTAKLKNLVSAGKNRVHFIIFEFSQNLEWI